jgi:hypothetical protein
MVYIYYVKYERNVCKGELTVGNSELNMCCKFVSRNPIFYVLFQFWLETQAINILKKIMNKSYSTSKCGPNALYFE